MTSDGGLLLVRDLDERLGFGELIQRHLTDGRCGLRPAGDLRGVAQQILITRDGGDGEVSEESIGQTAFLRGCVAAKR